MYTNPTRVRQVSGFVGNTNISDAFITNQIMRAESLINSYISDQYTIPLSRYYTNTITFSGTGSGSATMTITIDGTGYAVAVTDSLSASAAADLFRTAALTSNNSFITDSLGAGTIVTIWSQDGDDVAQVTISSTDPQTVQGITATGGTVTQVAPPFVEALATEIAAAYLLIAEYGPEVEGSDKDGYKRLAMWMETLKNIAEGKEKLFDYDGDQLSRSTTRQFSFYPTEASEEDDTDPTFSRLTMNKKY